MAWAGPSLGVRTASQERVSSAWARTEARTTVRNTTFVTLLKGSTRCRGQRRSRQVRKSRRWRESCERGARPMRSRRLAIVVAVALLLSARAAAARTARWLEKSVVYGVVPRNFGARGARAVTKRLDRLQALGVDTLWLSPIYSTPPGDFGYAVTDFTGLRPDMGTKADFKRMVDAAHRRGLRVLLDF